MNKRLTCYQVSALLNFYIEGKVNSTLKDYIEQHLDNCMECQQKANRIKTLIKEIQATEGEKTPSSQDPDYKTIRRLSAYMDNELNSDENIQIKKMTISNSKIRKELENLYKFQKAIHSAYEKTKNDTRFDYSKNILTKIQDGYEYSTSYFYKITTIFVALMLGIIVCFIYLNF